MGNLIGDHNELVELTSKGSTLLDQGGFVEQQANAGIDLEEEVKSLKRTLEKLTTRIRALEETGRKHIQPAKREKRNSGLIWLSMIFSTFALALSILLVLGKI